MSLIEVLIVAALIAVVLGVPAIIALQIALLRRRR